MVERSLSMRQVQGSMPCSSSPHFFFFFLRTCPAPPRPGALFTPPPPSRALPALPRPRTSPAPLPRPPGRLVGWVEGGARAPATAGGGPAGGGPALPPAPRVQVGGVVIARRHAAPVQDVRRRDEVHKRARPSLMSPVAGRGMWDWRVRGGGGEWRRCELEQQWQPHGRQ